MLQWIARRALDPGDVLDAGSLGNDMLAEKAVVCDTTAQVVAAPDGLSLHPGFGLSAEYKSAFLPLRTGTRP